MTPLRRFAALLVCLLTTACATAPDAIWKEPPVDEINNNKGLALRGYDPVAYFTDAMPREGRPDITYQLQGATYRFANTGNAAAFMADPVRYAPQFGGYCAYAVSLGTTADADPFQWAIVEQKLYVNNNAIANKLWRRHRARNIQSGHTNWPLIPKQPLHP